LPVNKPDPTDARSVAVAPLNVNIRNCEQCAVLLDERAPGSGDSTVIRCTALVNAALLQQASSSSGRSVDDAAPWPTKRAVTRAA